MFKVRPGIWMQLWPANSSALCGDLVFCNSAMYFLFTQNPAKGTTVSCNSLKERFSFSASGTAVFFFKTGEEHEKRKRKKKKLRNISGITLIPFEVYSDCGTAHLLSTSALHAFRFRELLPYRSR